jgi:hypothetical protein
MSCYSRRWESDGAKNGLLHERFPYSFIFITIRRMKFRGKVPSGWDASWGARQLDRGIYPQKILNLLMVKAIKRSHLSGYECKRVWEPTGDLPAITTALSPASERRRSERWSHLSGYECKRVWEPTGDLPAITTALSPANERRRSEWWSHLSGSNRRPDDYKSIGVDFGFVSR